MSLFTDQTGRSIILQAPPSRIVSLVPSQTELLHYLGLEEEVVGITKFCVHPEQWFRSKTRVGGTKQLHIDTIRQLQPDLIIANKEENVQEQVETLSKDFPVWISDINNLDHAYEMIACIGSMLQKTTAAAALIDDIRNEFDLLAQALPKNCEPLQAAYLIWKDPYMTVGHDTFIHDMMVRCGFENIFADKTRYPTTTIEELQSAGCEVLLLSSEPFPFAQKHVDELQQHLPATRIMLVDGEMFSWYGSRLLQAPAYFRNFIPA
ncbi:MAG TPA: helical backbone metal receptor [Chitinophagaceae bacterium]|nr:helical backbone metal receptor [Chitinophagaceae bacterium]